MIRVTNLVKGYFSQYGKLPSLAYISTKLNISTKSASEAIQRLKSQKVIIKDPKGNYYVPKAEDFDPEILKDAKQKIDFTLIMIRIIMGLVGAGAAIMSIYYTTVFLCEFLPFGLALLSSSIMIVVSVLSIDIIIILREGKYPGYWLFIAGFCWFIVLTFSIFSTVIGQYNTRHVNNTKIEKVVSRDAVTWEVIEEQEQNIKDEITSLEETLEVARENYSKMLEREERNWYFFDARNKVKEQEEAITLKRNELKKLQADKMTFIEEGRNYEKIAKHDFYEWFGGVSGIGAEMTAFSISVLPAVFFDIIAPLALAVSMFLKRRKKE
jgi:ABC-type multidrug transport system fused ATPase/permease subunit